MHRNRDDHFPFKATWPVCTDFSSSTPAITEFSPSVRAQSDSECCLRRWKCCPLIFTHCKVSARHFLTLSRPPLSAGTWPFCGYLGGAHTKEKNEVWESWSRGRRSHISTFFLPAESTSTCVKVHLSDLVIKGQKRVWVGQVHWQRKGEQSHENKRQTRVLQHCRRKKTATVVNKKKVKNNQ